MADTNRYPQIPSTVWWGVRSLIQRTPNITVDEKILGIQLGVQEAAAKAYVGELRKVGILTEENKATSLAQRWRLDDSYVEAVDEIVRSVYPEGLVHLAPPGQAERQKVVSWFLREGLGQGSAGNRAATYLLVSSPTPNESAQGPSSIGKGDSSRQQTAPRRVKASAKGEETQRGVSRGESSPKGASLRPDGVDAFPLNLNIQIHISSDAGTEQIESIFQAMRRYLYDNANS